MRVELASLKDNPMRDFTVDPIDDAVVERLRSSIRKDGFWGGVVIRKTASGDLEIVAGHHRVRAALAAKKTHANLFVRDDVDDDALVRIYSTENATQRGNTVTATAGTVASAVRLLARKALQPDGSQDLRNRFKHPMAGVVAKTASVTAGLGRKGLVEHLPYDLGISASAIEDQMANLKQSGMYGRILRKEAKRALLALEGVTDSPEVASVRQFARELKVLAKENEANTSFDFTGVAEVLPRERQVSIFRKLVLDKGLSDPKGEVYVALEDQAKLAKTVRDFAGDNELSINFIRQHLYELAAQAKAVTRPASRNGAAVSTADAKQKMRFYMDDFSKYVNGTRRIAQKMLELEASDESQKFNYSNTFLVALENAVQTIVRLNRLIRRAAPADHRCELCGQPWTEGLVKTETPLAIACNKEDQHA